MTANMRNKHANVAYLDACERHASAVCFHPSVPCVVRDVVAVASGVVRTRVACVAVAVVGVAGRCVRAWLWRAWPRVFVACAFACVRVRPRRGRASASRMFQ